MNNKHEKGDLMNARKIEIFSENWRFSREIQGDEENFLTKVIQSDYDDSLWKSVTVPHDWAIDGPFSTENDPQFVKVHADGILQETSHIGRTGGLPITGLGIYRRKFTVDSSAKTYFLEFDGIMSFGKVFVNGKNVAERPYGYSSFSADITECVVKDGENSVVVIANPKDTSSRWYTGAGIYRPVRLLQLQEVYVSFDGTYVTSKINENNSADISIKSSFSGDINNKYHVTHEIYGPHGEKVAETDCPLEEKTLSNCRVDLPQLWDITSPLLYQCITKIHHNKEILDRYESKFGIRTVEMDNTRGFVLNGRKIKLQGVCLHHDLGMLGLQAINMPLNGNCKS